MTALEVQQKLQKLASPEAAQISARYFKTGPGQYGEGDIFIGIRIPVLRQVAREHQALALPEVQVLLTSPIHEERMLALMVLVLSLARCEDGYRKQVYEFYAQHTRHINNWDLVDSSAPAIVGGYLLDRPRNPLHKWARSRNLWERRIAIIATQHFIRHDDFAETLAICETLLSDTEDLIHKATGWMLREVGGRDRPTLVKFLDQYHAEMPRTMLRYAIEHFPPAKRTAYLQGLKK